jgi:trimethylamine---corrinoid protein Co-methyltransferase
MGAMATGAREPGWQAAVDDALSTATATLAGADMLSGCGLLDGSRTLSYEHLVMEIEVYRMVQRLAGGIVVNDETLALDVIGRVGHGGTYLADSHTRRHAGELFRPTVWDRSPYDAWAAAGRPGARDAAAGIAAGILADHRPTPLGDDLAAELSAIAARADAQLS